VLIPEALGYGNWVSAQKSAATPDGQATYLGNPVPWGTLPIILAVEFFALAFAESQRNGEPDAEKRKYPGGPFDPLGFSKGSNLDELKLKEIKNGEYIFSVQNLCSLSMRSRADFGKLFHDGMITLLWTSNDLVTCFLFSI